MIYDITTVFINWSLLN